MLIGGVVAYGDVGFDALSWVMFILILVAGCLIQSASNLLNTYGDFKAGTDTVENETRSPELVTGVLDPHHVKMAGIACLGATCLLGLVFIWYSGWEILVYGILGVLGAGMYTTGLSYKYHGLGQPSVFLMMGILMPLGTYCDGSPGRSSGSAYPTRSSSPRSSAGTRPATTRRTRRRACAPCAATSPVTGP